MKKYLVPILVAICIFSANPARAEKAIFSAQTTNSTSTAVDAGQCDKVFVRVLDTLGTGTSVVKIQGKTGSEATYFTVATITNPDTTGELWVGPGMDKMVIDISACSSCSVTVTATGWRGATQIF